LKKKHRREKIREGYNAEMRMSKKIHDELANDVFNTMAFAETQDLSKTVQRESLIKSLDSIYARSRDISRESQPIDTGVKFPNQLREVLSDYHCDETNVIVHGIDNIAWTRVSEESKLVIYRVLQELMVNMKKHSTASIAAVRFNLLGGKIMVDYSDNGIGVTIGKYIFKNGLQNVENRIYGIGGKLTFDSEPDKGVKISFSCPA
ncbi:MAG TPA: ATP-binding protein, partial [Flavobacterium sp.]